MLAFCQPEFSKLILILELRQCLGTVTMCVLCGTPSNRPIRTITAITVSVDV